MHRPNEPEQVDASAAPQIEPADHSAGYDGAREGKAWGRPFVAIDKFWTRFEVVLCTIVLLSEVVALTVWVGLKGLSTGPGGSLAGIVLRAIITATVLGSIAYVATAKARPVIRSTVSLSAVLLGFALARAWASAGVDWASNMLNWYQQASTLTLVGGLRGVGTRLTLLLALLGGSLATAAGKHITIDLVTRFVRPAVRTAMAVSTWLISAVVCFCLCWGYFDHIAIENFEAKLDAPAGEKIKAVGHGISEYAYATKNQMKLDMMTWGFPGPMAARGRPVTNVRNLASPFWRSAIASPERRCIVPVTRFCEWTGDKGSKRKVWFGMHEQTDPLFAFAGIWRPGEGGPFMAFLTCEANQTVGAVHPKAMPVMLRPADIGRWLDSEREQACALAVPFEDADMRVIDQ